MESSSPQAPQSSNTQKPSMMKKVLGALGTIVLVLLAGYFKVSNLMKENKIKDMQEHNEVGINRMIEGDFEGALQAFDDALENKESMSKADIATLYQNIAETHISLGNNDAAFKALETSQEYVPKGSLEYFLNEGNIHITQGNIADTIESYKKALELDPTNYYAHNALGMVYLGEYDEESVDYEKSLFHNQAALDNAPAHAVLVAKHNLALSHFSVLDIRSSQILFEEYHAVYPNDPISVAFLAMIYSMQEDSRAKEYIQKAIELDPENEAMLNDFLTE